MSILIIARPALYAGRIILQHTRISSVISTKNVYLIGKGRLLRSHKPLSSNDKQAGVAAIGYAEEPGSRRNAGAETTNNMAATVFD